MGSKAAVLVTHQIHQRPFGDLSHSQPAPSPRASRTAPSPHSSSSPGDSSCAEHAWVHRRQSWIGQWWVKPGSTGLGQRPPKAAGLPRAAPESAEHPDSSPLLPVLAVLSPAQLRSPSCVLPLSSDNLQQPQELVLLPSPPELLPMLCHLAVQLFPLAAQALKPGLHILPGTGSAAQQLSPNLRWTQRPGASC